VSYASLQTVRPSMMMKPLLHVVVESVEAFVRFATLGAVVASAHATPLTAAMRRARRRTLLAMDREVVDIECSVKGEHPMYSYLR
jgi:hypothetical protein